VEVQRGQSERFAIVKAVDSADPAVADVVADWKKTLGAVGVHIILMEAKRESNLRRELLLANERATFRAFSVPRTIKATALRAAGWLNPRQLMARLGRASQRPAGLLTGVLRPPQGYSPSRFSRGALCTPQGKRSWRAMSVTVEQIVGLHALP
jgi:hypothetical protein